MASYIGKTDQPAAQPNNGADIMAKITGYLQNSQGLFIGESHDQNIARDFLLSHLGELKAAGVTTIYFETQHPWIQGVSDNGIECFGALNVANLMKQNPELKTSLQKLIDTPGAEALTLSLNEDGQAYNNNQFVNTLVQESKKHGIRVIGHDSTTAAKRINYAKDIDARNDASVKIISETRPANPDEKYIVFGGFSHMRKAGTYMAEGKPLVLKDGIAPQLGLPSVSFIPINKVVLEDSGKKEAERVLETDGYFFTGKSETAIIVAHRDRFTFSETPTYPSTSNPVINVDHEIPVGLFTNPLCSLNTSDDHALLSPPQVGEIIRSINAERGK